MLQAPRGCVAAPQALPVCFRFALELPVPLDMYVTFYLLPPFFHSSVTSLKTRLVCFLAHSWVTNLQVLPALQKRWAGRFLYDAHFGLCCYSLNDQQVAV